MIKENSYNTAWWGEPVGTIDDPSFFLGDCAETRAALDPFSWVEFKAPLAAAPSSFLLHKHGFALVDVQLPFRLGLKTLPVSASVAALTCPSAREESFVIEPKAVRSFEHERFQQLPGCTIEKLNERYARWANQLASEQPDWCLCVRHQGQAQGWFLSRRTEKGLWLILAMLAADAVVSGAHVYQKALQTYADLGVAVGYAAFSVRNTPVLNVYSQLGAKFLPPEGQWLWVRELDPLPRRTVASALEEEEVP